MSRDVAKEIQVLDDSAKDTEFLKKLLTPQKYKVQIEETKREILNLVRNRFAAETNRSAILGSDEAKKMQHSLNSSYKG